MKYFWIISLLLFRGCNKKRVFIKSLCFTVLTTYCLFILLFDPRRYSVSISITNQSEVASDFESATTAAVVGNQYLIQKKNGYIGYTIRRLGLKPLDIKPILLERNIQEPVVNDVLSFRYPIDIDPIKDKLKCRHWTNKSLDPMLNANRTLLIVVISAAEHTARRDAIRKTWGGQSLLETDWIQLIFLIGSALREDNVTKDRLNREKNQYNDLVQTNVIDTYANLTLKSLSMLYWTYTHCPEAQLVLKCDDDIFLNLSGLVDVMSEKQFKHANLLYGIAVVKDRPQRNPSNSLSANE